ncbi:MULTISPECIES: hypothetical protein [Janthinobacterium]|uniref:hypothetical protein n=1 Tax=Janthinobacterium TaxID=29580 RepID=UPI001C5B2BF2|nr:MULTISPECIES: hypothetical protein [Janthinobacterium]MBW3509256.1 hypothetical protein [Janthinobacterium sp. NKUCC06_STL]MCA1859379.1 hypothetical protein [Janthinobacterium lividum]
MKRDDFLKQDDVRGFIDWLAAELPARSFHLKMARSRFVPGGLDVKATGLEAVLRHYVWSTRWTDAQGKAVISGNWHETRASLGQLRGWLKDAIARQDEDQTLAACLAILEWGGVRGAIVFLKRLHAQGRLVAYFTRLAPLMTLDSDASLDALDTDTVERFDAGLTKIHALFDDSGSPIYDSRVGAAMAMLYAQYRSQAGSKLAKKHWLAFPSGAARGKQIRNPKGIDGGFAGAPQFFRKAVSCQDWAQWQVKLGWILRAVLEQCDWFKADGADMAARCHAFEACLFMLGYDLRCFGEATAEATMAKERVAKDDVPQSGWVPTGCSFKNVLPVYAQFRRRHEKNDLATFAKWYATTQNKPLGTAMAYCFPYTKSEFDLFDSSEERLDTIVKGGKEGLYAAVESTEPYAEGAERERICLVDALLAGRTADMLSPVRTAWLLQKGYAGTKSAANTLMTVGRQVGRHFGLLDKKNRPTAFYHEYFGDCMREP